MTGKLMLAVHEELCLRSDDSIPWAIGLVSYSFAFYSFSAGGICDLPSLTVTCDSSLQPTNILAKSPKQCCKVHLS